MKSARDGGIEENRGKERKAEWRKERHAAKVEEKECTKELEGRKDGGKKGDGWKGGAEPQRENREVPNTKGKAS